MSDTPQWQPGDLALCIKQGPWRGVITGQNTTNGPRAGQILTVSGTHIATSTGHLCLRFSDWPNPDNPSSANAGWAARRFIKVTPDEELEREAEEELEHAPG